MNCKFCANYLTELDTCKYCSFEADDEKIRECNYQTEHFDILHLDENEWGHVQIMDQLKKHDVEFILADMWDNIAFIIGCNANAHQIAKALHIPEKVVYDDFEHSLIIINLFELRYIRGELE